MISSCFHYLTLCLNLLSRLYTSKRTEPWLPCDMHGTLSAGPAGLMGQNEHATLLCLWLADFYSIAGCLQIIEVRCQVSILDVKLCTLIVSICSYVPCVPLMGRL
jgi:hypothetical protein